MCQLDGGYKCSSLVDQARVQARKVKGRRTKKSEFLVRDFSNKFSAFRHILPKARTRKPHIRPRLINNSFMHRTLHNTRSILARSRFLLADRALPALLAAAEDPLFVVFPVVVHDHHAPLLVGSRVIRRGFHVFVGPVGEVQRGSVEPLPGRARTGGTVKADPSAQVILVDLVRR